MKKSEKSLKNLAGFLDILIQIDLSQRNIEDKKPKAKK
jgi:hypothetical protein